MKKSQLKILNDAVSQLEEIQTGIQEVLGEEQEAFDNRSEKWQESEAGEIAQANLDALQTVIDSIENITGDINGLVEP